MYAGESAVFLGGHFYVACNQNSLVPANENQNLPASPNHPMTLQSALNIHSILRDMAQQKGGEKVPARIVDVVRESALRSVQDIDTAWAKSLVSGFYKVSAPLGLDLENELFKAQMTNVLMDRLKRDIETQSLHFTPYRFSSVKSAFKTMGETFTSDHADQVKDWVYDRFVDELQSGKGDLARMTQESHIIIGAVDHALRYDR